MNPRRPDSGNRVAGVRREPSPERWAELAARPWRRTRWRADLPGEPVCAAFGLPLHRAGTYYRRPAYTDGRLWLSQQGFDAMTAATRGTRASRQTRPPGADFPATG